MPLAPPEAGLTARTWLTVVFASAATEVGMYKPPHPGHIFLTHGGAKRP